MMVTEAVRSISSAPGRDPKMPMALSSLNETTNNISRRSQKVPWVGAVRMAPVESHGVRVGG